MMVPGASPAMSAKCEVAVDGGIQEHLGAEVARLRECHAQKL